MFKTRIPTQLREQKEIVGPRKIRRRRWLPCMCDDKAKAKVEQIAGVRERTFGLYIHRFTHLLCSLLKKLAIVTPLRHHVCKACHGTLHFPEAPRRSARVKSLSILYLVKIIVQITTNFDSQMLVSSRRNVLLQGVQNAREERTYS